MDRELNLQFNIVSVTADYVDFTMESDNCIIEGCERPATDGSVFCRECLDAMMGRK